VSVMHVLGFEDFQKLFNNCMDLADRTPPDQRDALLEIAEAFLMLANDCIRDDAPHVQNAPTIPMTQ